MQNLLIVATQVCVLFALMAVGCVCRIGGLIGKVAVKGIVNILFFLVTPCLVIHAFQRPFEPSQLRNLWVATLIVLGFHLLLVAIAKACFWRAAESRRCVLQVAAVFSNAGFMGIPLEMALFGADGVFYGVTYVAVFNVIMWSWGYCTMRGKAEKLQFKDMLSIGINPGTVGIFFGIPLFATSTVLPQVLAAPVKMLADLNTPLAMIVIGYYLAGAHFGAVLRSFAAYAVGVLRLVVSPLLLLAALYPFRHSIDRVMALSLITAAAAPVAAMVSMFASKYRRDVDLSVGLVSGTTILSIVSMPPVIVLAMELIK